MNKPRRPSPFDNADDAQRAADLYAMVQEFCTCNRRSGTQYTNYIDDHDEACGFRRAYTVTKTATREEGFTRA